MLSSFWNLAMLQYPGNVFHFISSSLLTRTTILGFIFVVDVDKLDVLTTTIELCRLYGGLAIVFDE